MKNWIIAALIAVIAVGGALGALATTVDTEANVEITVWQRVSDGELFLSTRPEGGRWTTHQTPLDMSNLSRSGRFRQGSAITVTVPLPAVAPPSVRGRVLGPDGEGQAGVRIEVIPQGAGEA